MNSWKSDKTFYASIYLAGDVNFIKQFCKEHCYNIGLCVTVESLDFVYTGGGEPGACVRLINYPRFPSEPEKILEMAKELALFLREKTCNDSILVETPGETFWITRRE